jgi:bifunctional DNA-binding transcriptional regulator/antitoxin component of YhaV-PrlF toxin-antitoxin module
MARGVADETTINDSYSVTVPAAIRDRADIDAGDMLRWSVDDEGRLSVELVKQREGVFEDFQPYSLGEDAAATHDLAGDES